VDKSKVQQAKKQVRKRKRVKGTSGADSVAQAVARAQADKEARDRELNRQKERKQAAKARKALLRQFVSENRLNDPAADQPYNFVHGEAVKRLYVTVAQRAKLGDGKLAIALVDGRYHLVTQEISKKILAMAPDTFIYTPQPDAPEEHDPYAEFKVPDDLMW
jgi:uncharacterized protein YaiL (DUF2058 family)